MNERRPFDRRPGNRLSVTLALAGALAGSLASVGCSSSPAPEAPVRGSGGASGSGGRSGSGGTTGNASGGTTGNGSGGSSGSGGNGGSASGGSGPADAAAGTGGTSGGSGGSGPAPSDGGSGEVGVMCGAVGQACCANNSCTAGTPTTGGAAQEGMTVLELKASGGDPYALFAAKNLLPIDGPDRGYITDTGSSFLFVLHQNGAEETVSSGASRQRNEVTVNPPNPAIYKGTKGTTMTYTWRFKLVEMNSNPTWCDIFQIKQHGPLGVAPYMALEADKGMLKVDTEKLGIVGQVPLSAIMNIWVSASVTLKYDDAGSINLLLKKEEDGSTILAYKNDRADFWDTTVDFVRPKWGLYRNKRDGAGEAAIHYNDMKIIRGVASNPAGPGCTCN